MISSDLYWELVRNNSSYNVRRGGNTFSADPFNVMNLNCKKYNSIGLCTSFGISGNGKGKLLLTQKNAKAEIAPSKGIIFIPLNRGRKSSIRAIKNILANSGRADLCKPAISRAKAIFRSQRPPKPLKAKKIRGASRK